MDFDGDCIEEGVQSDIKYLHELIDRIEKQVFRKNTKDLKSLKELNENHWIYSESLDARIRVLEFRVERSNAKNKILQETVRNLATYLAHSHRLLIEHLKTPKAEGGSVKEKINDLNKAFQKLDL